MGRMRRTRGLGRQAKVLAPREFARLLRHASTTRTAARDRVIVLLGFKAGLRAIEMGNLRWRMVLEADGAIGQWLALENQASKGRSGRVVPLRQLLRAALEAWHAVTPRPGPDDFVLHFRKGSRKREVRSQAVQALFRSWRRALGFAGLSSHSGRRTFGTTAARRLSRVPGASLRDVQRLLGHESLVVTQDYIDSASDAQRQLVELV